MNPTLTNKTIEKVDALLEELHARSEFNGNALLADKNGIVYCKSFGLANVEHHVPNTTKTKFRIGSVTKQMTAMAILQLVDAGELTLETTLQSFIADYPSGDQITIHHLLSNTTGIYNMTERPDILEWYKMSFTYEQIIDSFKHVPLHFKPGEAYEYSNANYILLSYILEKTAGISYAEYIRKYILNPLDMEDSGYDIPYLPVENRAQGYSIHEGTVYIAPYINMDLAKGAGGLYSTVEDLYKWDRALHNRTLLDNEELLAKMVTPVRENYAYGMFVKENPKALYHAGSIPGFGAMLYRLVEEKICIVLLSNYSQNMRPVTDKILETMGVEP